MKNRTNKKGFTIVELVIVIAVVAILAAVLIPTFASLVKKANESADIQLVRQMNTILKAEEAVSGKPATVEKVKEILADNGIVDLTPAFAESAFAWDKEENVVILINKTTQKGVFPKEYEGVDYKSTWELLAGTVNVNMSDLGETLDEAIANAEFGQTIVLPEGQNQELAITTPVKNMSLDLNGNKLTLTNGLPMEANGVVEMTNGDVESGQITLTAGSKLTLNDVDLTSDDCAIYPLTASCVNINGGTIISDCPIGTSYSSGDSRAVVVNISGATLGSESQPCSVGIMMITSGDINISDCTIYATDKGIYNRCGNVYVENTTIEYKPSSDYVDTYLGNEGQSSAYAGVTPNNYKSFHWLGGSSGVNAPIVVGDLRAKHYSYDANCTLVNVTVNSTNDTYPDVYLSQERFDVYPWIAGSNPRRADFNNKVAGSVSVKTTLTCDNTIEWAVNPGKNDVFADAAIGEFEVYADCAGFEYSNSGHGGVAVLYVDNIFVNGVEQAKGSTSANPLPAN